jgi:hypothetical protein
MTNALEEVIERAQELPEIEQDLVGEIVLMPCGRSLGVDCGDEPAWQKNHASALEHQLDAVGIERLATFVEVAGRSELGADLA